MAYNPIVIEKGLNAAFAKAMAEFQADQPKGMGLLDAAMTINSTSAYEKLGWIGSMPAVRQYIGEKHAAEVKDYEYTIRNKPWEASVPIDEDNLNDDQTGTLSMIPNLLVRRIMNHPIKLIVDLLNNGETGTAYDGVAFFSNVSGARKIDNLLSGTGTTLAQITADLESAMVAMAKFDDDNGEILNIQGDTVVCPIALYNKFLQIANSQYDPSQSVEGVYNPYKGLKVIADARLDATDANDWYLLCTSDVVKPFAYSLREKGKPVMEKKNLTKTWVYSAEYRGNVGYGLPHLAVKTVNT